MSEGLLSALASAPALFTLRNEIVEVLCELSVNDAGEITGHDGVAEEIIMRLVACLPGAANTQALASGNAEVASEVRQPFREDI